MPPAAELPPGVRAGGSGHRAIVAAPPNRKTIRRAHAFNEMRILEEQGRHGYHLVGFGLGRLEVEASDHPWEHLRLVLPSPATLALLRDAGWEVVGRWGVLTYLKRPARSRGGADGG
jgi:hypothetical protein